MLHHKLKLSFPEADLIKSTGNKRLHTKFLTVLSLLTVIAVSSIFAPAQTNKPTAISSSSSFAVNQPIIAAGIWDFFSLLGFGSVTSDDKKAVEPNNIHGGSPFIEGKPNPDNPGDPQYDTGVNAAPCGGTGVTRTVGVGKQFATIQTAINASSFSNRDTIQIDGGDYPEQVIVNKCINIVGNGQTGANATVILPPANSNLALSTVPGVNAASLVEVRSNATVTISNLTVSGPVVFPAGSDPNNPPAAYGVFVAENAALQMTAVTVTKIRQNPLDGLQNGIAIRVGSVSSNQTGSLDFTRVTVSDYQKGGIIVSNTGSNAVIKDSLIMGVGATPAIGQNGIQISDGGTATITNSTIKDNLCDNASCGANPTTQTQSAGILPVAAGLITLSGNTIDNNDAGYLIYEGDPGIQQIVTGNTFSNNRYFGFYIDQSNTLIKDNYISGGKQSAVVLSYGGNTSNTVANFQNNSITGASQSGIQLIDTNTSDNFTPQVTANFNRISNSPANGNILGIDAAGSPGSSVNAENNFWGCNTGANGGAGCDTTSGAVDSDPYLRLTGTTANPTNVNTGVASTITTFLRSTDAAQTGTFTLSVPASFVATFGTISNVTPLSNGTATATFTGGGPFSGNQTAVVTAQVDNAKDTVNVTVNDTTAPTVTLTKNGPDPTNASPVNFTVVFSENVGSSFATGDVTVGGTAGATTGTVTEIAPNDGTTFNVAVTGMTQNGSVTATVPANVAVDSANNPNTASPTTASVTYFLTNIELIVEPNGNNCLANGSPVYMTIQAAVAAAGPGYIINVCPGTYPTTANTTLNLAGLTIKNALATKPNINVSGGNLIFTVLASNVTISGLNITKTDTVNQNVIQVQGTNFIGQNNVFTASTMWSGGITTRAFEISSSAANFLLDGNTITDFRQPAYINGNGAGSPVLGTVSNNTVTRTKGFVVAGANVNFTGNVFGQTCAACGADIALLSNSDPMFYSPSNLLAISTNNDDAYISVQFPTNPSPSGRAVTFVDDSAAAGGDGRTANKRQTIQDGINNTLPGGTVNVSAGTYPETLIVDRGLKILGAKMGMLAKPRNVLADESTIVVDNSATLPVDLQADDITFDGFNFDIDETNPTTTTTDKPSYIILGNSITGTASDGYQNIKILNNRLAATTNYATGTADRRALGVATAVDMLIEGNYFANYPSQSVTISDGSTNLIYRNNDSFNAAGSSITLQSNFRNPAPNRRHVNYLIENNRFVQDGALLFLSQGGTIRNNTFTQEPGEAGILMLGGNDGVNITNNNFTLSNRQAMLSSDGGFGFGQDSNINFTNNTVTRPSDAATTGSFAAIDYRGTGGTNTIANNTLQVSGTLPTGNSTYGIRLRGSGSGNFTITGNTLNGGNVTATGAIAPLTSGLYITSNASGAAGIGGQFPASSVVNVNCNTFTGFQNGIIVYDSANGNTGGLVANNNITINNNNILGNSSFGANNNGTSASLNAQGNYWGAADGPGPVGPGSGDRVTPNVNFAGFLNAPATGCNNLPTPPPTVTINQAVGQNDPTSTSPITFTVVFSETVSGFDASDVIVTGSAFGTGATPAVTVTPVNGTTYTVTVSGMNQSGTVTARIPAGAATGADGANVASTSMDNTVFFNFVAGNGNVIQPVNPVNITAQQFAFVNEGATGSGAFVTGPATPPSGPGTGSAQLTIDGTGRENLATARYGGTRLADITALQYSAYTNRADGLTITLQFDADYDLSDASNAFQNRLVYEPAAQAIPVAQNTWQTFDTLAGKFYSSNINNPGGQAGCTQATPCTKAQLLAAFPNVGIRGGTGAAVQGGLYLRAGGPFPGGMIANTDNLVVGVKGNTTTFDFEPSPPTISIDDVSVTEGGTANFTVTQSVASQLDTTFTVNTGGGTATAGSDYVAITNQTFTIPANSTTLAVTVPVTTNSDTDVEPNETFNVNLSNAFNAAIADGQGVGTINNDDVVISFSSATYNVTEGTPTATITVTRNGVTPNTVTVNYATSNGTATAGSDYTATSGTLTFLPNDTSKMFTVAITDDLISEATNPETVNLTLSNVTGGATLGLASAVLNIFDNDGAGLITISGNIKRFNNPPPNTPLANVTVTLSGTSSATTTTDANGNYSFTGLTAGGNYLITPSCPTNASCVGSNMFDPINRNYQGLFVNVTNANFIGYNANNIPRTLQVGNGFTNPGQTVTVPITINSQGNESSISFSLTYDSTLLSNPTVACGSDAPGCTLTVNPTTGSIGIIVEPTANLAAGTRQIVTVTFNTTGNPPNTVSNTPVNFSDTPTPRSISDDQGNELLAAYNGGLVVFAQGLEGDVAGRFTGNGLVNSGDLGILRSFVAQTEQPNPMFNEFQRADAAPGATKGNGALNSSDIIQVRRYAAGLDALQSAGGPSQAVPPVNPFAYSEKYMNRIAANTVVRVVNISTSTTTVTVPIRADLSNNEQGFDISISFNTAILSNPVLALGSGAPAGSVLTPNTLQAANGRVGFVIDSGTPFGTGTKQIATVTFTVAGNAPAGLTPLMFINQPIALNTSDSLGNSVPTTYMNGNVNILGPTAAAAAVGGRVTRASGKAVSAMIVTLTDVNGFTRNARTDLRGFYQFDGIPTGETYVMNVSTKLYAGKPQVVTVLDNLTGVDFIF